MPQQKNAADPNSCAGKDPRALKGISLKDNIIAKSPRLTLLCGGECGPVQFEVSILKLQVWAPVCAIG